MARVCPGCSSELVTRSVGAIALEGCTECGGLWFEGGRLSNLTRDPKVALLDLTRCFHPSLSAGGQEGTARCPGCDTALVKYTFPSCPDMPMDVCKQCGGIWLAYGQLEAIALRVLQARGHAAQPAAPAAAAPGPHPQAAPELGQASRTIRCRACDALNDEHNPRCTSCGAELHAIGEQRRPCPHCGVSLAAINVDGAHYLACAECSGVWLEDGRLPVYLRLDEEQHARVLASIAAVHAPAPQPVGATAAAHHPVPPALSHGPSCAAPAEHPSEPHQPKVFRCPSCHYEMHAHLFGSDDSVSIHVCSMCRSTWFDAGQLQAAYELSQREGFLSIHSGESEVWARD